jgi:hypothetical protein
MKHFIFAASLLSLSLTALADPATLPPGALLQVQSFGGFAGPNGNPPQGVRVFADGRVVSFSLRPNSQPELLARLSTSRVSAIRRALKTLSEKPLQENNPEGPMCADAPDTLFQGRVGPGLGKDVTFWKISNCKDYSTMEGAGSSLKNVLEGLRELKWLQ